MYVIRYLTLLLLFVFSVQLSAQEHLDYMNARKLKRFGKLAERENDLLTATLYYQGYLDKKPKDYKMAYHLADNYRAIGNFPLAQKLYEEVWKNKPDKYPLSQFYLAETMRINGDCENAVPIYVNFRKRYRKGNNSQTYRRMARERIESCEDFDNSKKPELNPNVVVTLLPQPINGEHLEASPIYLDKEVLLYNSMKSNGKLVFDRDEELPKRNFYIAEENNRNWIDKGLWAEEPILQGKELGNGAFNQDKSRFYFSACEADYKGKINCDLYRIDKKKESWSHPINLGKEVNTKYTETQPTVGLDERGREIVYFVSDRDGGKGGLDIWYTIYDEKRNTYRTARNCGSKINTKGNEMTPFVDAADGTFYFSSDGHKGYGQLDIFFTSGLKSRWDIVSNLVLK